MKQKRLVGNFVHISALIINFEIKLLIPIIKCRLSKREFTLLPRGAFGIGLETGRLLVQRGASVSVCDIQEDALKQLETTLRVSNDRLFARTVVARKCKDVED